MPKWTLETWKNFTINDLNNVENNNCMNTIKSNRHRILLFFNKTDNNNYQNYKEKVIQ